MKSSNRFAKGSGVYSCRFCKRNTRSTGGDNCGVRLCVECYDIAGYENMILDGGISSLSEIEKDDLKNLIFILKEKGIILPDNEKILKQLMEA